jgi:hypothetical protein
VILRRSEQQLGDAGFASLGPCSQIVSEPLKSCARAVGAAYLSPKIRRNRPVAPIFLP